MFFCNLPKTKVASHSYSDVLLVVGTLNMHFLVNRITLEGEESNALIKGVSFGTLQSGGIISKTLYLSSSGSPGNRVLDLSIRTKTVHAKETTHQEESCEILQTISILVVRPFVCTSSVAYHRSLGPLRPPMDLALYDRGEFDPWTKATVMTEISNAGNWNIEVGGISWASKVRCCHCGVFLPGRTLTGSLQEGGRVKYTSSSLGSDAQDEEFPLGSWLL